jgi:hypothetical protein
MQRQGRELKKLKTVLEILMKKGSLWPPSIGITSWLRITRVSEGVA